MVQRVNITLPDELHQRLQAFKEDKDLNVSAVCQEALEQEVSLREAVIKAMSKREAVIARLKVQAENELDGWYQQGKKDGLEAATNLDYCDFVRASDWMNSGSEARDLSDRYDDFAGMVESAENSECPERFQPKYCTGFVDGILDFWNDIKDEVEPKPAY